MDALIPYVLREPHQKSCQNFTHSTLVPILGDMIQSFIKLPDKDYILAACYNLKIMPDLKNDFKYVTAIKYNRTDTNMYIILNKEYQIDSFSYNMRYLFREPELFLNKSIPFKNVCYDLFSRLSLQDKNNLNIKGRISRKKKSYNNIQEAKLNLRDSEGIQSPSANLNRLEKDTEEELKFEDDIFDSDDDEEK